MIAPRTTRLIRTPSLEAWQHAILTCCGDPGRPVPPLILVPTRSAARRLRATIAERFGAAASDATDVLTRSDFYDRLFERFAQGERLSTYEREAMLEAGAHAAITDGAIPPFHLRPSLIGEMLELYDELLRYQQTVDDFERLLVSELEPQAGTDRGAERMLRQTRFLAAAFRGYASEVRRRAAFDEHELRAHLLAHGSSPWTHIVITTADRAAEPGGLWPADCDLFARLDGIERIDVVSTEAQLEAGWHARVHDLLPGIEEVRVAPDRPGPAPVLEVPEGGERRWFVSRDREDELADAIRMIRQRRRREGPQTHRLDRTAIVFARPLPYLYPARELFASAGVPFQCDDTLPLAGEPFAAAVDLVLAFAASQASREATIALLRSPHVRLDGGMPRDEWLASVSALDTVLLESNYLGGPDRLAAIAANLAQATPSADDPGSVRRTAAAAAARAATDAVSFLAPLFGRAPASSHLETLRSFLEAYPPPAADLRERELRARKAVREILDGLIRAYRGRDSLIWDIGQVTAAVHRWIEAHTFEPRSGEEGVHLIDAVAARYGSFDDVHLVGLIEGEWPERRRRNIFYSSFLLRRLGWPDDRSRDANRAAFADLVRLARRRTVVSTVQLENESLVEPSSLLDELESADLEVHRVSLPESCSFLHEALLARSIADDVLSSSAQQWVAVRRMQIDRETLGFRGRGLGVSRREYGVSSVEVYTQCPFKYFARHVLALDEEQEAREGLSARDRGVFVHEVLQRFFERWVADGMGTITADRLDEARARLEEVAEPLLAELPPVDAALERARLFGSPAAPGVADLVLRMEAERAVAVVGRRLEDRFSGVFELDTGEAPRRVGIRGIVDRIDLLADGSLRVLDYKASVPIEPIQLAVYAVTAAQRLRNETRRTWRIGEAAYVVYGGRRGVRTLERRGESLAEALTGAERRFVAAIDAIAAGEFPVRPIQTRLCASCAYDGVCRKEYVNESDAADDPAAV